MRFVRRVLAGVTVAGVLVACAAPAAKRASTSPAPATSSPGPAGCSEAARRLRAELAAAAEGCLSDEGCVVWDSCHAVIRDRGATPSARREEMRKACRGVPDAPTELDCAPRPVRCVARRCLRF